MSRAGEGSRRRRPRWEDRRPKRRTTSCSAAARRHASEGGGTTGEAMLADLVEKLRQRHINLEKQRGKLRDDNLRLRSGKPAVAVGDEMSSTIVAARSAKWTSSSYVGVARVMHLQPQGAHNNNQARLVEEGCVRLLGTSASSRPSQRLCAPHVFCNLASRSRSRGKIPDQRVVPTLLEVVQTNDEVVRL
jgi:hypothetical protein